ncbi:MAG: nucleotide sugar dehydrogenase [Myxococcota bacterium]
MANMSAADALVKAIQTRTASIGICGLGYVGLPLVAAFRRRHFRVWGFDIDDAKIQALVDGQSYIAHIDFGALKAAAEDNLFIPTADFGQIDQPDVLLIAVPTPLTKTREPDLSAVKGTCEQIAAKLRPGQLIILESTTYPMTTQEVCLPILESSGLKVGEDFFLAYSPEREDPGNPKYETSTIPKVVGANDAASRMAAEAVYASVIDRVVAVSDMAAAELCKIFENTFRAVNIALVNELKMMCQRMGIDVWEVIDAAATKPFGFMPFYPGPGLGGHCIPIDPFYLTWKAREYDFSTRFIELAGEINTRMPYHVVDGVMHALNERATALRGARILVLGLAYKKNVDDVRESPSLKVIDLLKKQGALVAYNDPHIPVMRKTRHFDHGLTSVDLTLEELGRYDAVMVLTDHDAYDWPFIVENSALVIDTRNATKHVTDHREKIRKL